MRVILLNMFHSKWVTVVYSVSIFAIQLFIYAEHTLQARCESGFWWGFQCYTYVQTSWCLFFKSWRRIAAITYQGSFWKKNEPWSDIDFDETVSALAALGLRYVLFVLEDTAASAEEPEEALHKVFVFFFEFVCY